MLSLRDFRNYAALDFAPAPGLNVFAGPNAQGKSNLLEAIGMLATGQSFRARREIELIRDGAPRAEIAGEARIAGRRDRLARRDRAHAAAARAKPSRSTARRSASPAFLGRARVVTFVPADLHLVAGGPALRRTFLNGALAQLSPAYYRDLARYGKIVAAESGAAARRDRARPRRCC